MELGSAEPTWASRLALTPFATALATGAALIVAQGEPARLVFATAAALSALGASDEAALREALFSGGVAASRRLAGLAGELPEGAPPRLEMFRFVVAGKPVSLYWLCARLRRDGDVYFVAADAAACGQGATSAEAPLRFLWRVDAQDRFGVSDAGLVEQLGAQAPQESETIEALSARAGLGSGWREALAAKRTFSRLSVAWPEPGRARARVARLSGTPLFAADDVYQGFRGFGVLTAERIPLNPPKAASRPTLVKPVGDAAALLGLLQRQHAPAGASAPSNAANGPALAIITALAALLQPKPGGEAKPTPRPAPGPEAGGAEIVVLRPHAVPTQESAVGRQSETVPLTSQERDAFKEIARSLGVNVRNPPAATEPPEPEPPAPEAPFVEEDPEAADFAGLIDILPIAVLIARHGEALFANRTLLSLGGYADLADLRARDGLRTMFRGRDPKTLAPGGTVVGVPIVGAGDQIQTVDAQVRRAFWRGEAADLIALRRSREAEHQEQMRAVERETAVHAARARDLAAALDAARDGMARLDRTGRLLGLNKGAEALFGYDQKELAGESFLTLLAPASHAAAAAGLERLVAGEAGPVAALEAIARHSDGRQFPVRLDLGRLANQPEPDFFLLVSRADAETGLAEAQAARAQAEKDSLAKTELLSRVNHEMRTPLHAIMGFAEVILEERFGPIGNERYRDYVRDIHASGKHVLSLANDLLDLTKLQLGKMDLQFAPTDVNRVIRECVTLMQPQAARERIIMRLSLYDRLPNVMADERSLRQIMLNLMANAVKYNEPGGQVIVSSALDDGGSVILRVRDTGVGMNESELAVALEPFRRVPGAKPIEGSGIGLPLTKALVEANHADFSIRSRRDQGTLVEIAFPVQRAAQ